MHPLFICSELLILSGYNILDVDCIKNNGQIGFRNDRYQFRTSIKYVDIKEISILPLKRLSNGKTATFSRPIPYLVLKNEKGRCFRFSLGFMSKRCVKNLLSDLQFRCKYYNCIMFDTDKLMEDFINARFATKEQK